MICDCNCPDEITLVKSHLEMQISIRPNFAKYFDPNKMEFQTNKKYKFTHIFVVLVWHSNEHVFFCVWEW